MFHHKQIAGNMVRNLTPMPEPLGAYQYVYTYKYTDQVFSLLTTKAIYTCTCSCIIATLKIIMTLGGKISLDLPHDIWYNYV